LRFKQVSFIFYIFI